MSACHVLQISVINVNFLTIAVLFPNVAIMSDVPKPPSDQPNLSNGAERPPGDGQAKLHDSPVVQKASLMKANSVSDVQQSQSHSQPQTRLPPSSQSISPSKGTGVKSVKNSTKQAQSTARISSHDESKTTVVNPPVPLVTEAVPQLNKLQISTPTVVQNSSTTLKPTGSKSISKNKGIVKPSQAIQKKKGQTSPTSASASKTRPQSAVKTLATTDRPLAISNSAAGFDTGAPSQRNTATALIGVTGIPTNPHSPQAKPNPQSKTSAKPVHSAGVDQPPGISRVLTTQKPATTTALPVNPPPTVTGSQPVTTQVTRALAPRPTVIHPSLPKALERLPHAYPTLIAGMGNQSTPQTAQPATQGPSITREIMKLISTYLGSTQQDDESFGGNMSALRDRLEADPSSFDSNRNLLAWHVRDAIRSEFYRVKYPIPPPAALLLLVTQCEILLTNTTSVQCPFYFPGRRVTVPTDTGARRMGTTLQLRSKVATGREVTEVMLHLDGPQGGEFPWVQSSSLLPASTAVANQAAQRAAVAVKQRTREVRPRGGAATRGGRRGRKGTRARGVLQVDRKSATSAASFGTSLAGKAPSVGQKGMKSQVSPSTGRSGHSASGRGSTMAARTNAATGRNTAASGGRVASSGGRTGAGKSGQEITTVSVPVALVCASSPPRRRIIDDGRQISYVSGSLRRALGSKGNDCSQDAAKIGAILGIERLVARRNLNGTGTQYFVKWSGRPFADGSWEKRESLLEDVPGLVREFDIRHPDGCGTTGPSRKQQKQLQTTDAIEPKMSPGMATTAQGSSNQSEGGSTGMTDILSAQKESSGTKCEGYGESQSEETSEYIDDVTGVPIPSWVDTPILELNIGDMVLQIRRPSDYVLHNDADAAARDTKKRQSEFKKKHVETAVQIYSLSRNEARLAIEHGLRAHRENAQRAIQFPRGLGKVSPYDHGTPFSVDDVTNAPASWEGYFTHLGMKCTDYVRELPPYMPTVDDNSLSKIVRGCNDAAFTMCLEHRERARNVVREAFRYDGSSSAPSTLFRDGVKAPPGNGISGKKRARSNAISVGCEDIGFGREKLLRERDDKVGKILKTSQKSSRKDGMWYDSTWACWRPMQPKSD